MAVGVVCSLAVTVGVVCSLAVAVGVVCSLAVAGADVCSGGWCCLGAWWWTFHVPLLFFSLSFLGQENCIAGLGLLSDSRVRRNVDPLLHPLNAPTRLPPRSAHHPAGAEDLLDHWEDERKAVNKRRRLVENAEVALVKALERREDGPSADAVSNDAGTWWQRGRLGAIG